MDPRIIIGSNMAKWRKARNLNQTDLGNMLNVSRASVCWMEKGRGAWTVDSMLRVCDALQIHLFVLLEGVDG